MADKVSTLEVRQRIGDMLNRVALRHDEFIIERKGKPLAALVPVRGSSRCGGLRVGTLWMSWSGRRVPG
jgi:prevent-host-death family protein